MIRNKHKISDWWKKDHYKKE